MKAASAQTFSIKEDKNLSKKQPITRPARLSGKSSLTFRRLLGMFATVVGLYGEKSKKVYTLYKHVYG